MVIVLATCAIAINLAWGICMAYGIWWWLKVRKVDGKLGWKSILGMRLRQIPPSKVIPAYILARKNSLGMSLIELECQFMAKGNPMDVVEGMVLAKERGINLEFTQAAALDLVHISLPEAVDRAVNPKTTEIMLSDCRTRERAATVNLKAKLTTRWAINRLIGGETEETFCNRVAEFAREHCKQYLPANPTEADLTALAERIQGMAFDAKTRLTLDAVRIERANGG